MNTKLENKVQARNLCNIATNRLTPLIFAACAPFVGQKVKTTQGNRTVKFNDALQATGLLDFKSEDNTRLHVWMSHQYDLTVSVRFTLIAEDGRSYDAEAVIYVGKLDGGTLVKLYVQSQGLRTDFNADEILATRTLVKATRAALQEAESNLYTFGEHDSF